MKSYRDNGAIGAVLDEYERAVNALIAVINKVSVEDLVRIVDSTIKDKDCRSIQTILTHVVESGYAYVIEIRKSLCGQIDYVDRGTYSTIDQYQSALTEMFKFNEALFEDYPNLKLEEYNLDKKFKVRWGQTFDPEQILEHAIVHILRHRRQIERFVLILDQ